MMRHRSLCSVVVCSTLATLSLVGCSSSGDPIESSGTTRTGGSSTGSGGSSSTSGSSSSGAAGHIDDTTGTTTGSGGSSASSSAATGSGTTTTGSGGSGGSATTGSGGSGGSATTGSGGSQSGSGGQGGGARDGGAAGMSGTGDGGMMTPGKSAGCGKAPMIESSMYNNGKNIPITAANMQRRYILSVPTNYDNTKPYKLIIAWHQRDGNDNQMYANKYYHLQPLSNDTTIFVAPNGQLNGAPCKGTGNGEGSCGWPNTNDSDMALGDAVVAQVEANFCIDTNRIFATGWSYGGSMSYANACERPLGLPTATSAPSPCTPGRNSVAHASPPSR